MLCQFSIFQQFDESNRMTPTGYLRRVIPVYEW